MCQKQVCGLLEAIATAIRYKLSCAFFHLKCIFKPSFCWSCCLSVVKTWKSFQSSPKQKCRDQRELLYWVDPGDALMLLSPGNQVKKKTGGVMGSYPLTLIMGRWSLLVGMSRKTGYNAVFIMLLSPKFKSELGYKRTSPVSEFYKNKEYNTAANQPIHVCPFKLTRQVKESIN